MVGSIEIVSPATVANVGCGFDMMGFAVEGLGDRMILRLNNSKKITISKIEGDGGKISRDPENNTAGVSLIHYMRHLGIKQGVDLEIQKLSPVGSGLGSSASSTTAAVFGLNELLGNPVKTREELIPFALEGERLASGGIHADNVAPAMLGGMMIIRSVQPLDLVPFPVPEELLTVLLHPDLEVLTKAARALVPPLVPIGNAVIQMANVGGFIMGMVNNDLDLVSRCFEDRLAEPYRAPLIKGYADVKKAALERGAVGCSISGSGPTIFAFAKNRENAEDIARAMKDAFSSHGVKSESFIFKINRKGTYSL